MIKQLLRPIYFYFLHKIKKAQFILKLNKTKSNIKLVIGASEIVPNGWLGSEQYFLNILEKADWQNFFEPNSIKMMLAEHVWEHLTPIEGQLGASMCYLYLANGGHLRLAVPDGYHPDPNYIDYVKIGGSGAGAFDHKVLYNYKSLTKMLTEVGFEVELLEYFDEKGEFHEVDWQSEKGHMIRSKRYDSRNEGGKLAYTSLIVDAIRK